MLRGISISQLRKGLGLDIYMDETLHLSICPYKNLYRSTCPYCLRFEAERSNNVNLVCMLQGQKNTCVFIRRREAHDAECCHQRL